MQMYIRGVVPAKINTLLDYYIYRLSIIDYNTNDKIKNVKFHVKMLSGC